MGILILCKYLRIKTFQALCKYLRIEKVICEEVSDICIADEKSYHKLQENQARLPRLGCAPLDEGAWVDDEWV